MENCQDVVMDLFKTLNNSKSETAFADPVFLFRWAGWIGMGWGFREMISFVLGGGGGGSIPIYGNFTMYIQRVWTIQRWTDPIKIRVCIGITLRINNN